MLMHYRELVLSIIALAANRSSPLTPTPRKSREKTKAAISRQEILNVAAKMMRQRGYADMSLRGVASEVGMKAGSLYYHFPSKDALAAEVMRLGVEMVHQAVQQALEMQQDASARDRLLIAIRVHLETLCSASDFSSAHIRCYAFVPSTIRDELAPIRKAYDRDFDDLIENYLGSDAKAEQVRYMRNILLGALNWSLEWFDPERDSIDSYINTLSNVVPEQP